MHYPLKKRYPNNSSERKRKFQSRCDQEGIGFIRFFFFEEEEENFPPNTLNGREKVDFICPLFDNFFFYCVRYTTPFGSKPPTGIYRYILRNMS